MSNETKTEVGQVWESRDVRDAGRRVRIVDPFTPVGPDHVVVVNVETHRRSKLRKATLRQRYQLVEPGGAS